MERLEKKRIHGNTYYYYSQWGRVNGKSKRIWQKYLGKLEDIVQAVGGSGPTPQYAEIFQFGVSSTLWKECEWARIIEEVDQLCPKRSQGLSVGQYIALAALNRAIHPVSKNSLFDWFSKTSLLRYFPHASKANLSSQSFWDHMNRIEPQCVVSIWTNIIKSVVDREAIDLSIVNYDGTNFYTFIDTFNTKCEIAKRGKNKQGRSKLRQISYALFCTAKEEIPLYFDVYEGNRNDTKQFPLMIQKFHDFLKENWRESITQPQITLIFDKGNNSKEKFSLVDALQFHYVGSIKLSECKELAEISNRSSRFISCKTVGMEGTKAFCLQREIYGKERTVIVSYNQNLFQTQWLTLHNDITKSLEKFAVLQKKLEDRAHGFVTKGKCPTIASITKQCKEILQRQYMTGVIEYEIIQEGNGIPQLAYTLNTDKLKRLSNTYLGKTLIVTDREHWNNERIILAYRSQFHVENVFKEIKDRDIGSWWPLFHWTDQKIKIHSFYCTVAILLRALAYRKVQKAGIKITMKRLLAELEDIKEVIVLYPSKRRAKQKCQHIVLSKTSELQETLLSIFQLKIEKSCF